MGGIPSKPDPTKSMQVIGAGFPRTGTNSVQLALELLLDGPVHHGGTHILAGSPEINRKWILAMQASRTGDKERALKYVRECTAGYVGIADVPGNVVIAEMMEIYPDAKVLLVTRDPEKWYKAILPIIGNAMQNPFFHALMYIHPTIRYMPAIANEITMFFDREIAQAGLGKKPGEWGPYLIEAYNKRIIAMVPKERLLVMNLSQGWEPLCKFLGKPIPNVPFPRVNDASSADRVAKETVAKLLLMWLGLFTTIGACTYGGFRLWNMQ